MIITKTEVKSLIGIEEATTKYDARIDALIPEVQGDVFKYCQTYFEILTDSVYIESNSISFVIDGETKTIHDENSQFVNAGFVENLHVRIQGSKFNNTVIKVTGVTASDLTIDSSEEIIAEANDKEVVVLITLVQFPKGIKLPVARLIGSQLFSKFGVTIQSERFDDYSVNYSYDDLLKGLSKWRKAAPVIGRNNKIYDILTKR